MRKIIFQMHADTVGTDHAELHIFHHNQPGGVTNDFLDNYAESLGRDWADMYMPDIGGDGDDYQSEDEYYEYCGWWWEEYSPAKHNGVIDSGDEGYEEE
jgi:hypothetical protein